MPLFESGPTHSLKQLHQIFSSRLHCKNHSLKDLCTWYRFIKKMWGLFVGGKWVMTHFQYSYSNLVNLTYVISSTYFIALKRTHICFISLYHAFQWMINRMHFDQSVPRAKVFRWMILRIQFDQFNSHTICLSWVNLVPKF